MKSPISRFTVSGNSMFPTLKEGQDVLSINWFVNPKVGDIVVIKKSGKEMVKRIEKVVGDQVFVVGDNPGESTDSRNFGPVSREDVIGKVIYVSSHPELDSGSIKWISDQVRNDMVDCPCCDAPVIGIYGRKDAICKNCGFKLTCCE